MSDSTSIFSFRSLTIPIAIAGAVSIIVTAYNLWPGQGYCRYCEAYIANEYDGSVAYNHEVFKICGENKEGTELEQTLTYCRRAAKQSCTDAGLPKSGCFRKCRLDLLDGGIEAEELNLDGSCNELCNQDIIDRRINQCMKDITKECSNGTMESQVRTLVCYEPFSEELPDGGKPITRYKNKAARDLAKCACANTIDAGPCYWRPAYGDAMVPAPTNLTLNPNTFSGKGCIPKFCFESGEVITQEGLGYSMPLECR